MKLKKPPYLEVYGSSAYYRIQADHRRTALEMARDTIQEAADRDAEKLAQMGFGMCEAKGMGAWVIESLVQGAFLREYHIWEKDTKEYFNGQHQRRGGKEVSWRNLRDTHTKIVTEQLSFFGADIAVEVMQILDVARRRANEIKHEPGLLLAHFVQWDDLDKLMKAVWRFWHDLDSQEEYTLTERV